MSSEVVWRLVNHEKKDWPKLGRFADKKSKFGIGIYCGRDNLFRHVLHIAEDGASYQYCEVADIPKDCKQFGFEWQNKQYTIHVLDLDRCEFTFCCSYKEPDRQKQHCLYDVYGRSATICWCEETNAWKLSMTMLQEVSFTPQKLVQILETGKVWIREFVPNVVSAFERHLQ